MQGLGHWKVDCLKAKGKKKESITEANLAQVFSTHASTSQADGSTVVMKDVRWNNLYYLKGSTVIGQVKISISSDNTCTQVWQMKVGHGGERYLQAPAKKGSLEGATTCNLELGIE